MIKKVLNLLYKMGEKFCQLMIELNVIQKKIM